MTKTTAESLPMRRPILSLIAAALVAGVSAAPALAVETEIKPAVEIEAPERSFDGFFGHYEKASLQRGFQVYKEVCAACHGMRLLAYRHLGDPGGPFYDPEYAPAENPVVKAIAAEYQVPAGPDENGDVLVDGSFRMRPAIPSDHFVSPFPNEIAAKAANGGALPPDLSVMAKARHGGADYIYKLLLGYEEYTGDHPQEGLYYNPYFPGGWIAMPPIINEGGVTFTDGTEATAEQITEDLTNFLMWTAEPKLEERKRRGVMTMIYLVIFAGLLFMTYRKVWANAH